MATFKLTHPRSTTVISVSSASRRDLMLSRGYTEVKTEVKAEAPKPKPKAKTVRKPKNA